jgi:hypothetical protein
MTKNHGLIILETMTKKIIIFILSIFLFTSCETIVDLELDPHESRISVYCLTGNEIDESIICLGYSKGILEEEEPPAYLDNVEIIIRKNGEILNTFFSHDINYACYLDSSNIPIDEQGAEYMLEISHTDYETVTANQIMPNVPAINSATYEVVGKVDPLKGTPYDRMTVRFNDDAATDDYYHVQGFVRNQCCENEFYSIWTWSDNFFLGETVSSQGLIFEDNTFSGSAFFLNLKVDNTYINSENHYLYIRLSKITRDRFLYLRSKKNYYDAESNPFAELVTVHSNIEGGYGIFGFEATNMYQIE